MDGGLQIRPAQHSIVKAVIDNPGAVVQLNMGLGKTRVIVPMLLLHWRRAGQLVRLNFLSALLPEAFEFMHHNLTASSMFGFKLLQIPFHRDVEVSPERIAALLSAASFCLREGGALFMTPEARCSLHLKQHELWLAGREGERAALASFEAIPCKDVLDESDALLRVKYQLVYAVGAATKLPALDERCNALRLVLDGLLHSPQVAAILADERVAVREPGPPGAFFANLRLLPGEHLEAVKPALNAALAAHALANTPAWLQRFAAKRRAQVLRYIIDTATAADAIIPPSAFGGHTERRDALLALRGLIASGVVVHSLLKRWRVDHGVVPEGPLRRKRLAVPFRAADTSAERSEFAFADTTLALTTLSYALGGLSDEEVVEAFTKLESQNLIAREKEYAVWFEASKPNLSAEDADRLSRAIKIGACFSHLSGCLTRWRRLEQRGAAPALVRDLPAKRGRHPVLAAHVCAAFGDGAIPASPQDDGLAPARAGGGQLHRLFRHKRRSPPAAAAHGAAAAA